MEGIVQSYFRGDLQAIVWFVTVAVPLLVVLSAVVTSWLFHRREYPGQFYDAAGKLAALGILGTVAFFIIPPSVTLWVWNQFLG